MRRIARSLTCSLAFAVACSGVGASSLEDPTRPPGYEPPAPAAAPEVERTPIEWRLTMIRLGGEGARAVLNGESVREGDRLDDTTIVAIRAAEVVLDEAGEQRVISLLPAPESAPAPTSVAADADRTRVPE